MSKKAIVPPDPIAAHAEMIGRVTIAWNDVQYVIFLIFAKLSGLSPARAQAVFFSLKSDSSQREITHSVAKISLASKPALWKRYQALMAEVGRLAGERNAATHTMWGVEKNSGKIIPTPGAKKHGLLKDDFATQFKDLEIVLRGHYVSLVKLQRACPRENGAAKALTLRKRTTGRRIRRGKTAV